MSCTGNGRLASAAERLGTNAENVDHDGRGGSESEDRAKPMGGGVLYNYLKCKSAISVLFILSCERF